MTTSRDFVLACYKHRPLYLRLEAEDLSFLVFFVIILLFCIRASTRQNETTRHFDTYGNKVEKIDLESYLSRKSTLLVDITFWLTLYFG